MRFPNSVVRNVYIYDGERDLSSVGANFDILSVNFCNCQGWHDKPKLESLEVKYQPFLDQVRASVTFHPRGGVTLPGILRASTNPIAFSSSCPGKLSCSRGVRSDSLRLKLKILLAATLLLYTFPPFSSVWPMVKTQTINLISTRLL